VEQKFIAKGTNRTSRLQITSNKKGVVWLDQVSLMPSDTFKVYCISIFLMLIRTESRQRSKALEN
jgi:hypothetical protein